MAENVKTEKPTGKTKMFCDPSPAAYKLADIKMKIRAMQRGDPKNLYWLKEYNRHTLAVQNAKPMIDTKPPLVRKSYYHKTAALNSALLRHTQIEAANAVLLRQLASIYNGEIKTGMESKPNVPLKQTKNRTKDRTLKTVKIMNENFQKFQALQNIKPLYRTKDLLEWYKSQQLKMNRASRYPPFQATPPCTFPFRKIMENSYGSPKQFAYLLVEVEDKQAENLIIELYADLCPFTVKNFQRLCKNTKATACDCRTYRCKKIGELHSVQVMTGGYKKLYWIVGEHVDSAMEYSQLMSKESSSISHKEAGLVTRPKGRAGGVFFITVGPCPHLDQYCYVFGKIDDKGMDFLKNMEKKNTEENGQLIINMHITDCGVLANPDDVPPPMLLHDFINQARLEIMPFIRRKPDNAEEWKPEKSDFGEYLKDKAKESRMKHEQLTSEMRSLVESEMDVDADAD